MCHTCFTLQSELFGNLGGFFPSFQVLPKSRLIAMVGPLMKLSTDASIVLFLGSNVTWYIEVPLKWGPQHFQVLLPSCDSKTKAPFFVPSITMVHAFTVSNPPG